MSRISMSETFRQGGLPAIVKRVHDGFIYRHHAAFDAAFDARHGIETEDSVALADLDFTHPSKSDAVDYEPTPINIVRDLIGSVASDRENAVFVDLGCGKGRTLIAAAELGFTDLLGVEFAEPIADVAQANLETAFKGRTDVRWRIENADAGAISSPLKDLVLFLYNPFGEAVLQSVLDWAEAHIAAGFSVEVIYYNPQNDHAFQARRCFRRTGFPILVREKLRFLSWHGASHYETHAAA